MSVPEKLYGFVLKDTHEYKDCGYTGYLYHNEKFNCPFLYIKTEDTNNFFSVHFRTPEEDNTGISHMLEHITLLGSQKYPIRNIFFELNKRSYSTSMNAFTSSEYTAFPFSSTNETDFFNDLDVYLDSVFHPQLSETKFLSECHHLLFEDGDPNKALIHGGVIYNEVVGPYSKQQTIFHRKVRENFYPDSPSRFDCGGTPDEVPNATYESVVNHHKQYYHPVNSFFYLYGHLKFPMEKVFEKVSEAINQFDVIESPYHPELYKMKPWEEPRNVIIDAPADEKTPLEEQQQLSILYLIDEKATNDQLLSNLDNLVHILGKTNNCPLYQSLVLPGHVKVSFMNLNLSNLYPYIEITLIGFKKEKTEEIKKIVLEVIKKFCEDPSEKVEEERLDCYYHNLKLLNKKVPSNLGLILLHCFAHQWIHGANPLNLIDFDANLDKSINDCKQKGYLKSLAKRFLLDNKHCLFAQLNPVIGYNENLIEKEKKKLEEIKKNLTQEQVQEILNNMKRIAEEQQKEQPLYLLPQIHLSDISKINDFKSVDDVINDKINIFINPTNGVVYSRIVIVHEECDIPNLWLIQFLSVIVNKSIGAGRFNEYELSMYSERWVSSLSISIKIVEDVNCKKVIRITISCNCLNEDIDKLQELMKIISTETHWDNHEKIELIANQQKSVLGKIVINGMDTFNSIRAAATLDAQSAIEEAVYGLTGFNKFCDFITQKPVNEIAESCEKLYKQILTNGKITAYVSCGEKMKDKVVSAIDDVIKTIEKVPKFEYTPVNYSDEVFSKIKSKKFFLNLPIPTGTVSLKKLCVKGDQIKQTTCLSILARILSNEALLDEVRDKNGAYSGFAYFSPRTGVFSISTYRDTVPTKNYSAILEIIKNIDTYITDESVERAVVSYLSQIDAPKSPSIKGLYNAIQGITKERNQKRRDILFDATAADVKEAAKYLTVGDFDVSIATSSNVAEPPDGFEVVQI